MQGLRRGLDQGDERGPLRPEANGCAGGRRRRNILLAAATFVVLGVGQDYEKCDPRTDGGMNWKIIVLGGIAYYVDVLPAVDHRRRFIHSPEGVLGATYRDYAAFWRPELNAVPPDMASLMKLWVPIGLFSSVLLAGVYSVDPLVVLGSGLVRGVKFGVVSWLFGLVAALGYWGILNLPNKVWAGGCSKPSGCT